MQLWDKNEFLLLKKEHNFYREQAMNLVYCLKQNNTWKSRAVGATLLCAEWSLWRCWQTESWERLKIKSTRNAKDNDHVRWRDLTLSYFCFDLFYTLQIVVNNNYNNILYNKFFFYLNWCLSVPLFAGFLLCSSSLRLNFLLLVTYL